jgi:transcriptional regulator with XRE-family HTH domain
MSRKKSADTIALGATIRSVRVRRGYSQESFATHAGLDRSYYGAIERGEFNISFSTLVRIADGLDVPIHELVPRITRSSAANSMSRSVHPEVG